MAIINLHGNNIVLMIKFLDIYKQDKDLHKQILKNIKKLFKVGDFILGKEVDKFEINFAKFCGSSFAISCGNGTDALTIALKSLNLPNNSEVIIPAMTYCSTAFAIINANLKPVLVDTEYLSPTINIKDLRKKITKKTKVILPVHLYGSVVNITSIKKIIKNKNIFIVDDCAQAHGAYDVQKNSKNKMVGSLADISCFSLYPGKNLGAYGDAGIITSNNKKLSRSIKKIRNLGSEKKFHHDYVGVNSRLDTIQAIILNKKLTKLNTINKNRQKIAKLYNKLIINKKITLLNYSESCVYHQYVILTKEKKKLIKIFNDKGIQYGFHYPFAIHQLKIFRKFFKYDKFRNSEQMARDGISIPIDPNLSKKDVLYIIKTLNEF
jgi:dTDP-4-amino-4,6-dideoxygalactose transaminase